MCNYVGICGPHSPPPQSIVSGWGCNSRPSRQLSLGSEGVPPTPARFAPSWGRGVGHRGWMRMCTCSPFEEEILRSWIRGVGCPPIGSGVTGAGSKNCELGAGGGYKDRAKTQTTEVGTCLKSLHRCFRASAVDAHTHFDVVGDGGGNEAVQHLFSKSEFVCGRQKG